MRQRIFAITAVLILLFLFRTVPLSAQSLIWETNIGGVYNEIGGAGRQCSDGNYLILGSTFSYGAGDFDIYLLKVSPAGDTLWVRTFGGASTEYGYDFVFAPDNAVIIVGSTKSFGAGKKDIYLLKSDSLGNLLWSKTIGGVEDDEGWSIRAAHDSGFIICGTTASWGAGYGDLYLVRIGPDGNTIWTKTFGGAGGESGACVRRIPSGGYIAAGSTGSFGLGYSSLYAVRVDNDGDSVWADAYGGEKADFGYGVETTIDGGFILAGATTAPVTGYADAYLLKLDSAGHWEWERTFGGTKDDRAYAVTVCGDGGFMLVGTTEFSSTTLIDGYVIRTDPFGNLIWADNYGGDKSDYGRAIFQDQNRDYVMVGHAYSQSAGGSDIRITKIRGEATAISEPETPSLPDNFVLLPNYPNPFNGSTTIEYSLPRRSTVDLTIYNIIGEIVCRWRFESQAAGHHSLVWDTRESEGRGIASGIYFCTMSVAPIQLTRKLVLLK